MKTFRYTPTLDTLSCTLHSTLSYTFIHSTLDYHTLSYTIIHFHTLSYTFIHFHTLHYHTLSSFGNLKEHIRSLIRPEKKSIFGIHDPSGVRYLFQLRVGLSPLRYHKTRHNFIDTPSNECPCNHGIEDTNHFLFLCSFYDIQRATLLNTVIEIIRKYNLNNLGNQSNLCLYGHRSINLDENRKILLATINYIKET